MRLKDKIIVVTGGASGIGAAIARLFVAEGGAVALVDRSEEDIAVVIESIGRTGEVFGIHADVTDAGAAAMGMSRVIERWGQVDVLVTAAGISIGGTVATTQEAGWDHVFAVNVKGTYLWARATIPHMAARGQGSIVTVGSQLAISSGGSNAAYIASKGAIVSLTKTMAVDHAAQGIRVNALMPGSIDTPMARRSLQRYSDPDATAALWAKRHALGRVGRPEEVAAAALFLASDESSFTTGSLLFVDGGWTAM